MASQKRMVDLNELIRLLNDGKFDIGLVGHVRYIGETIAVKVPSDSDCTTSSPEHRTLTGLPVELAALKERVEKLEYLLTTDETIPDLMERLGKVEKQVASIWTENVVELNKANERVSAIEKQISEVWNDKIRKYVETVEKTIEPKASAPTPPPCPEGYEHLDPPAWRTANKGEFGFRPEWHDKFGSAIQEKIFDSNLDWDCWIVRPKAAPAAEPKQDFERIKAAVNALGEELQKDGRRLGVPLGGKIPGGDAYVELCYALRGETNPLRRPGGAK